MRPIRRFLQTAPCALVLAIGSALHAQECRTVVSRTALAELSGAPILGVSVDPLPPRTSRRFAATVNAMHVRTQEEVVRRDLLFAPGDTVDTLRVAESLRRLRREPYLVDAYVSAHWCRGEPGVVLRVTTRDGFTTRPRMRLQGSGTMVLGAQDGNVNGSGRELGAYAATREGHPGGAVVMRDPWFAGTSLLLTASVASYGDGHELRTELRTRRESVFDPLWLELAGSTMRRLAEDTAGLRDRRTSAHALVGRRLGASRTRLTVLLAGAELERARLDRVPAPASLTEWRLGPDTVQRTFAGGSLGLVARTARFDTLTWIVPGQSVADVPRGPESEVVVSGGRELVSNRPAAHLDAWLGYMLLPRPRTLVVADLWAYGYRVAGHDGWEGAAVRGALAVHRAAARGKWTLTGAAERLARPDPDLGRPVLFDPSQGALSSDRRPARATLAGSLERTVLLSFPVHAVALEAGAFVAGSLRWRPTGIPAGPGTERLGLAVVGGGLRLVSRKPYVSSVRLDVGVPVARSAALRGRPFAAILVAPAFDANRRRTGRR